MSNNSIAVEDGGRIHNSSTFRHLEVVAVTWRACNAVMLHSHNTRAFISRDSKHTLAAASRVTQRASRAKKPQQRVELVRGHMTPFSVRFLNPTSWVASSLRAAAAKKRLRRSDSVCCMHSFGVCGRPRYSLFALPAWERAILILCLLCERARARLSCGLIDRFYNYSTRI